MKELLNEKPVGTFIVHRDSMKNTELNPYTIYAMKFSKTEQKNRVCPANVRYAPLDKMYFVGNRKDRGYSTLKDLIQGNRATLKYEFVEQQYVLPPCNCQGACSHKLTQARKGNTQMEIMKEDYTR